MLPKYEGHSVLLDYLRVKAQYGKEGSSLLGLSEAAEAIGFKTAGAASFLSNCYRIYLCWLFCFGRKLASVLEHHTLVKFLLVEKLCRLFKLKIVLRLNSKLFY
ncbi:MAG: hypothetical protein ACK4R9_14835, partial [Ignavibacterium sp.]